MELSKTKSWVCDSCGEQIEDIKDGWVEWLELEDKNGLHKCKDIRIVHRIKCIYNEDLLYKKSKVMVSDMDLESFSGSDGLMELLEFISDNKFENNGEVLEIIKRIHIPGYEEARLYFDETIAKGIFEPNTKPGYYTQNNIAAVLDYKKEK